MLYFIFMFFIFIFMLYFHIHEFLFTFMLYFHIQGDVMHGSVHSYSWFIFTARENLDASLHIHVQLTKKHSKVFFFT